MYLRKQKYEKTKFQGTQVWTTAVVFAELIFLSPMSSLESHLLVLWGEEARAQEDRAEPDIRITRWNSIPGMENMMRISSISIHLWTATYVELNSIRRSLCVIIVRALIYLNWLLDWPMSWHSNTRYFNKLSYFVWSPLRVSDSAFINNIWAQTQT